MKYGVVLFHTTSAALRAEKIAAKSGHVVKLIPTPREFSSDCGIALRCEWADLEHVRAGLEAARITIASLHQLGSSALPDPCTSHLN
ncbi:hypothetical protein TFLX_03158 [Thermoflexales bacterium]|nr:hypothetical protein TFLX_03158 [Thermoflexales bacterium]